MGSVVTEKSPPVRSNIEYGVAAYDEHYILPEDTASPRYQHALLDPRDIRRWRILTALSVCVAVGAALTAIWLGLRHFGVLR